MELGLQRSSSSDRLGSKLSKMSKKDLKRSESASTFDDQMESYAKLDLNVNSPLVSWLKQEV
jgi:hypothetical protein